MENGHELMLKNLVTNLIEKMGFSPFVEVTAGDEEELTYYCSIRVEKDQNFLIGQHGINLAALQHLVRILARKETIEKMNIVVDVNDYFVEKRSLLEKEVARAVDEVLQNNVSVSLRPMLPYERKIVHAFLSSHQSVTTESIGEGGARKVMVRPRGVEERA